MSGRTRVVALIGDPVSESLSPRMQNAAFAARALDFAYVALPVRQAELEDALRGLIALGFAGANVTTPHKRAVAEWCGSKLESVNTLVVRDGSVEAHSTDAAVLEALSFSRAAIVGAGGAAAAFRAALPGTRVFSRRREWPPDLAGVDLVVNATSERDQVVFDVDAGSTVVDLPYPETATARAAREAGARVVTGLEVLVAQGAASFELWTGVAAPIDVMRTAVGL